MKILVSFILLLAYQNASSQVGPTRNWTDSEVKYTDSKGNLVKFIHSLPRGGGVVYKNGKKYGYVVFWTRIINQSAASIELQVKFPKINYFKSPDSYIHIVLPKESMQNEKVQLFDYGLTNLQSLVNDEINQISFLKKKINPQEDYYFYQAVLIHINLSRSARAKFEVKDKNLFYKISMGSDTTLIPCGSLAFKK
ncbi:MAG: hypothetical protein WCH59_09945 [Chitinophagia bacterium]|jgi:hypothetical protein